MSTPNEPGTGVLRVVGALLAVAIVGTLVAFIVVGSGTEQGAPPTEPSTPPAESGTIRLAGSNTIGSRLAPDLAEAFLRTRGATDVARVTSGGMTSVTGTLPEASGPTRFDIEAAGTETAIDALRDGTAELGMASRRITAPEAAELSVRGDLTSRESEHIVALDAVAVVVRPESGVQVLSLEQLRGIFTCSITDWAQVGGQPGPIRVLARDANSGTFELFRDRVLAGQPLCPAAELFADSQELAGAVSQDPSAIGFVGLPFVGANTAVRLFDGAAVPVGPDSLSISTETYLLTRRLYLYQPTLPQPNAVVGELVTFALSETGQRIAEGAGFVSPLFPPMAPPPEPCVEAPAAYCAAIGGATRVPFDVRFAAGTIELDNRAYRNLDLLVESLSQGQQVLLIGFADNAGTDADNQALSEQRAAAVRDYLIQRGAQNVTALGFGEALPVDTNDTVEGREQNRRVEVYLRG